MRRRVRSWMYTEWCGVLFGWQYGLKKKVIQQPEDDPELEGRLGRTRKTPAEIAVQEPT